MKDRPSSVGSSPSLRLPTPDSTYHNTWIGFCFTRIACTFQTLPSVVEERKPGHALHARFLVYHYVATGRTQSQSSMRPCNQTSLRTIQTMTTVI